VPNFVENAQIAAEIWRFFHFSKQAAVRHLGIVMRVFGLPRRAFGGLCHCEKLSWNQCSSFDNMHVFDFKSLVWKRLFTPQNCFFLGFF